MKSLVCELCQCIVAECDLHTHLANVHGWFGRPVLSVGQGGTGSKPRKPFNAKSVERVGHKLLAPIKNSKKAPLTNCTCCGVQVSKKKLAKHEAACLERQKEKQLELKKSQINKECSGVLKLVLCPKCSTPIAEKKLKSHMTSRCPNRSIVSQVTSLRSGKACSSTYNDPEIAAYLNRNPEPEKVGPRGLPQDKYRRSAYGRSGMEYDSWGRGE
ncbi:hypothetical protein [Shewanella pneumatophori]|uniref:Uncharacterized protein n=1 Tax=Shewanella pneumatophori TaxID=314092 RepID=A0A9X2CF03_9GAMM|nr:hypothetical protein [Shewanella pneumatophori]MCL1140883.1 hypothetical protein [Shewanella pneumatophori]